MLISTAGGARAADMAEPYKSWVEQYWGCKQESLTFRVVCARTAVAQFCSGKYLAQLQAKGCGATAQGVKAISAAIACMNAAKMDAAPAQFKGPYENAHRLYWEIANAGYPGCKASKEAGTVVQATGCAGAMGARTASGTQPYIASLAGTIDAFTCTPPEGVTIGAAQQSAIDGAIGRAKALVVKAKGLGSMWLAASETACKAETELLAAKNICAGRVKQGEKEETERKDREKAAEIRRKIAEARVRLQMVITDSNTFRRRAAECGYAVGSTYQYHESESCQLGGGLDVPKLNAELACIEKERVRRKGDVEEAKAAIKKSGVRDLDDAKARVGCKIEDLVNATIDKLCQMFPLVCKIVRDGQACYRQAGDAVFSTVKDLARITSVPWTLEGLRGLSSDIKKLEGAVHECWAWVKRSAKEVAKEAFKLLCAEPRGYLGQKWCPVLEQAGQCFRDALNAGVARTAVAALERYAGGTESATEDLVSGGDVSAVKTAIASCNEAIAKAKKAGKEMVDDATEWARKIKKCLQDVEKCGSEWAWKVMQKNVPEGVKFTFAAEGSLVGAGEGVVVGLKGKATGTIAREGAGFAVTVRIDDEKKIGAGTVKVHAKGGISSARAYKGLLSSPADVFPFASFMGLFAAEEAISHALQGFGIPVEVGRDLVGPVLRWLNIGLTADVIKRLFDKGILVESSSELCLVADLSAEDDIIKDVLSVSGELGGGACGGFVVGKDGKVTFSVAIKGDASFGLGLTIKKVLGLSGKVAVKGSAAGKITVDCGIDASENWGNLKMATFGIKKCLEADKPYKLGVEVTGTGTVEAGVGLKGESEGVKASLGARGIGGVAFKGSLESAVSKSGLTTMIKSLSPTTFLKAGGWSGAGKWSLDVTLGAAGTVGGSGEKAGQGLKVELKATGSATCVEYCSGGFDITGVRSLLAGGPFVSYTGGCRGGVTEVVSKCAIVAKAKPGLVIPVVTPVEPVEPVGPVEPVQPRPPVVTPVRPQPPVVTPIRPAACAGKMNPNVMTALECTATGWGKEVCTRLVKKRERGARYRDLDDMTAIVGKAFGAGAKRCATKKGRAFLHWAWPKARCEKGAREATCARPYVHLCQNQFSRAGESCKGGRARATATGADAEAGAGRRSGSGSGWGSGAGAGGKQGYLTGDGIYLRKEPSKSAGVLGTLFKRPCKEFKVIETSVAGGGLTWMKIAWQGKVGFIAAQHVALGSCP